MAPPRGPSEPTEAVVARWIGRLSVALLPLVAVFPWLLRWDTLGFHDWDVMQSHRELVRRSLLDHGELPFWNPFACGGFPAWGYIEGATVLVSPWLPLYLGLPMPAAIRLEVLGAALIGAAGAWVAAGRMSSNAAARAMVVAAWAVNGRWGLQAASGHTWHLAYALAPWCFVAFERARGPGGGARAHAALGVGFALLVYHGGIYPLPHTALLLGLYALVLAASERQLRPLVSLAAGGAIGIGLAAPKLWPMFATFDRAPRLVDSTERFPLATLWAALTSRQQGFYDRPAPVSPYGWHEWGIYVGVGLLVLLVVGAVGAWRTGGAPGRAARALAVTFLVLFALGLGDFHPLSPWHLLHAHAPFFGSMHVPSRFLHPALLALALAAAPGVGRIVDRLAERSSGHLDAPDAEAEGRRAWVLPFAAAFVVGLGIDVALVAQKPMTQAMWMVPPRGIRPGAFEHRTQPRHQYVRRDWAAPLYLPMLANQGVLRCYGTPPFEGKGALGADDPRYRGLLEIVAGEGEVRPLRWSPNGIEAEVEVEGPGARLVYDMNFDRGWRGRVGRVGTSEDGSAAALGAMRPTQPWADRVSIEVPPGASTVVLSYRPPGLDRGLGIGAATLAGLLAWRLRELFRARRAGATAR